MELLWIDKDSSFFDIKNQNAVKTIKWSKKYSDDLINLSREYFNSAYSIAIDITSGERHDNIKSDMWFLPSVYLFRQSLELLLKGAIAIHEKCNPKLQESFLESKHNLSELYSKFLGYKEKSSLCENEKDWLIRYLENIEEIDSSSDLFRYPHSKEFMNEYGNKFLDIVDMWNRLIQSYTLVNKEIYKAYYLDNEFDANEEAKFFSFASHGIGNCYLWDSPWDDGFHKQIVGYSEAGEFLYKKSRDSNFSSIYPFVFLYRNAIELALKRLLFTKTEICVDENIAIRIKNSHNLGKVLWKNIKPLLIHYGELQNYNLEEIEFAERYIKELKKIDKNSDTFRYPFSYSFEYKFNNVELDIENVHIFLKSIFNFLDGCDFMFNAIRDYESEIRGYYYE